MKTVECIQCNQPTELEDDDAPICDSCLRIAVLETLEKLGQPIIWDPEDGILYMPKGKLN